MSRAGVAGVIAGLLLIGGCTVPGHGMAAAYEPVLLGPVQATAIGGVSAAAVALSPDATLVAVRDPARGVCVVSVATAAPAGPCLTTPANTRDLTVAFAPDGGRVAVLFNGIPSGPGTVGLIDLRSGTTRSVPAVAGVRAEKSDARTDGSDYLAIAWNQATGHLALMNQLFDDAGPQTRLVDYDPDADLARIVAQVAGPGTGVSQYMAANGPTVLAARFEGAQIAPNLIVSDVDGGTVDNRGTVLPLDTATRPLAVDPTGHWALLGGATADDQAPPRLYSVEARRIDVIPGMTGSFVAAAFSPDGGNMAVITTSGRESTLWLAAVPRGGGDQPGSARAVARSPLLPGDATLTWSRLDVIATTSGVAATAGGSVVGWQLRR